MDATVKLRCFTVLLAVVLAGVPSARAAEIDVLEWSVRSSIQQEGAGFVGFSNTQVQNPFVAQQSTSLLLHSNSTSYDFSWDAQGNARFLVSMTHATAGAGTTLVINSTSGGIDLRAPRDTRVDFSGQYQYSFGNGFRVTSLILGIYDVDSQQTVASQSRGAPPPFASSGALTINPVEVVLTAGRRYLLIYNVRLDSDTGSATSLSHGNGSLEFNLRPVIPEPGSLALLGLLAPAILRRRRGH